MRRHRIGQFGRIGNGGNLGKQFLGNALVDTGIFAEFVDHRAHQGFNLDGRRRVVRQPQLDLKKFRVAYEVIFDAGPLFSLPSMP
jgi:hypothetical protein